MKLSSQKLFPFLLLVPIILFFYPAIFSGKLAIPADTIPGLYHPMRDALNGEYPNGPPFKNFLITDAVRQQYVWRQFSIDQLKKGQIPWWNPYNFSGTPHLANFQSASFYPLNFIFWLTDFTSGWNLLVVSQQIMGALFLYFYLRNLKLTKASSLFGAFTWIFSGHFIAWLEWNTAIHVVLWSPLILLSIDKLFTSKLKGYIWWSAILTIALISQFFAGYPQPWMYFSLLQIMYLVWRFSQNRNMKTLVKIGVIYILFLTVISFQLLETFKFSNASNRIFDQGNVLTKKDWFLPYQNLIQVIVPDFFGNPATLNYWGVFNYTEFVGFIGVIPLIFVIQSWFSLKKSRETLFFTVFLILSLVLATKNPISLAQFKLQLPFLSSSQPSRWIAIANFSLAVLASFGLNHFHKKNISAKIPVIIIGLLLSLSWLATLQPNILSLTDLATELSVTKRNLILPTLELFSAGLILFTLAKLKLLHSKKFAIYFLITISVFSGVRFARKFTPFTDKKFLYPQTEILNFLQNNAGLNRYMTTDRRIMAPNINMAYNLYTIEGYDPLYIKSYSNLIWASESNDQIQIGMSKPFNRIVTTDQLDSEIINLLGVKYVMTLSDLSDPQFELVLTEGETRLYQNKNSYPRAFFTNDPFTSEAVNPTNHDPVEIVAYTPNKVVIRATTPSEGHIVLSDANYPGWSATINGVSAQIIDWHSLRATIVPEGNHEIVFEYSHPQLQRN